MPTAAQPIPLAKPRAGALADVELPGLLMRRALAVACAGLVLLLILGIARARSDTLREMEGSLDLARASQVLASLREVPLDDALRALRNVGGLRHLELALHDESGTTVLRLADDESDVWLSQHWRGLSAWMGTSRAALPVPFAVPLRDGRIWTAVLSATPDSEVFEAATNLIGLFLLMLSFVAALLAAMHWIVRRSLSPLQTLVDAIGGVEQQNLAAVKALPRMPIRELEAIAHALRHLADAQERSESGRRVLAHRVMSLQEDERQTIARDLHDEFGQRLTALRVDASWLQRTGALDAQALGVVRGMVEQITLVQDDVRRLLVRLRPMDLAPTGVEPGAQAMERLCAALQELVAGWSGTRRHQAPSIQLHVRPGSDVLALPQDVSLALYRMTQEALTNVMRHAGAAHCLVDIAVEDDGAEGAVLTWRVRDDGRGIADLDAALRRGTGLAGLKDRVWTLGGDFACGRGPSGTGTELRAAFRVPAAPA